MNALLQDRRIAARLPMSLRITLVGKSEKSALYSTDISTSGIFVETDQPLPVGSILEMAFTIGGAEKVPVQAQVQVARVVTADEARATGRVSGMGMKFGRFSQNRAELVAELRRRLSPPAPPKAAPAVEAARPAAVQASKRPAQTQPLGKLTDRELDAAEFEMLAKAAPAAETSSKAKVEREEFLSLVHQALEPRPLKPARSETTKADLRNNLNNLTLLADDISWSRISFGIMYASLLLALAVHLILP